MKKAEFLKYWQGIKQNQKIRITPIPYRHEGSTYANDGIRITGSQKFVDTVLSNLKDVLKHENNITRLQVTYRESKDRETGELTGSYASYIQVCERGPESKMMHTIMDGSDEAAERLANDSWGDQMIEALYGVKVSGSSKKEK